MTIKQNISVYNCTDLRWALSSKNQLTTVKFDLNQAEQLLSKVLFHLANSPLSVSKTERKD